MNIYYIFFFIILIFLGIFLLIYYIFNRKIEKFYDPPDNAVVPGQQDQEQQEVPVEQQQQEVPVVVAPPDVAASILREEKIECSWSNTQTNNNDGCFNVKNEVCTMCPEGMEPDDGFIIGDTGAIRCTPVAHCQVNCLSNVTVNFTSPGVAGGVDEEIGYKISNTNVINNYENNVLVAESALKMTDENCNPGFLCPKADVEIPQCDTESDFKYATKIEYGDNDGLLCCKYKRPNLEETDLFSCPPAPGVCPPVYKYEYFPDGMADDSGNGVKLLVSTSESDAGAGATPTGRATPTYDRGSAYAFRASNFPPVSYLEDCPESDEMYSNLKFKDNCEIVGNDAYCCGRGSSNKPTLVHGMYPACELTYVNLLNSINEPAETTFVTSNIVQMYNGYNLFDTNFYHVVHASNAKSFGFLSNDLFYGCISDDGAINSECLNANGDFTLLEHNLVSPGIYGGDIDIDILLEIENSTPLTVMGAGMDVDAGTGD